MQIKVMASNLKKTTELLMKKGMIVFSLLFFSISSAQSLEELRKLILVATENQKAAQTLIEKSKNSFSKKKKSIYECYYALGNFFMAKHVANPFEKLNYFDTAKKALDNAVSKDPKNIEIRFMRYVSQEQSPSFLGYNKNMEEDKKWILQLYKHTKDQYLLHQIKNHFKL